MACEHKRLKSVNCVIMCADCGTVLPAQYAAGGDTSSGPAGHLPIKGKAFGETSECAKCSRTGPCAVCEGPEKPTGEGMEPKKRRTRKKKEGEANG